MEARLILWFTMYYTLIFKHIEITPTESRQTLQKAQS